MNEFKLRTIIIILNSSDENNINPQATERLVK